MIAVGEDKTVSRYGWIKVVYGHDGVTVCAAHERLPDLRYQIGISHPGFDYRIDLCHGLLKLQQPHCTLLFHGWLAWLAPHEKEAHNRNGSPKANWFCAFVSLHYQQYNWPSHSE
jgi:hypothetical protein